MYSKEANTTNLPAQIDLYVVDGDEYKFPVAKGGGPANNVSHQETKALLTPGQLENFRRENAYLGTVFARRTIIAFVIGGTSAKPT